MSVVAASPEHLSSSAVQTEAEEEIVCALARKCGVELIHQPGKIPLGGGVYVEVDGATPDLSVVVEAYARQGKLKGAHRRRSHKTSSSSRSSSVNPDASERGL